MRGIAHLYSFAISDAVLYKSLRLSNGELKAAKKQPTGPQIYQLKITLLGIKPPIWRRFQVPGDMNLAKLHQMIQEVMGWKEGHMHQFRAGKIYYGVTYPDDFDGR